MTKRMLIGQLQIGYLFWLPTRQYGLHPTLLTQRAISISGNAHYIWSRQLTGKLITGRLPGSDLSCAGADTRRTCEKANVQEELPYLALAASAARWNECSHYEGPRPVSCTWHAQGPCYAFHVFIRV
jgi:hypothetical protein